MSVQDVARQLDGKRWILRRIESCLSAARGGRSRVKEDFAPWLKGARSSARAGRRHERRLVNATTVTGGPRTRRDSRDGRDGARRVFSRSKWV